MCEKFHFVGEIHGWIRGGGAGVPKSPSPGKSQNTGFLRNTGPPNRQKNYSYQASIQCWSIISPPAKRHFAIKMSLRWWTDDGPLIVEHVCGFSLPHHLKNVFRVGPSLAKLSGSAHESNRMWNLNEN